MPTISCRLRAKSINSASYEKRNMSARRGAQFVPIGIPTICWKTFFRKNHENVVYQKLKHLHDVIFRVLIFGVRAFLHQSIQRKKKKLNLKRFLFEDKASKNYTFVCNKYYVSILIEELGLNWLPGNPTYNLTDFFASEVLDNHNSVSLPLE